MKASLWGTIGLASISMVALQATGQSSDTKSEISRALSAAPPSIALGATVVRMDDNGHVNELRYGMNGWTCITHDPGSPIGYPVCVDRNGLEWFEALMAARTPNPDHIGSSYILKGGTTWSNTDPSATKLPQGIQF